MSAYCQALSLRTDILRFKKGAKTMLLITGLTLLAISITAEIYVKTYNPEVWEELNREDEEQ